MGESQMSIRNHLPSLVRSPVLVRELLTGPGLRVGSQAPSHTDPAHNPTSQAHSLTGLVLAPTAPGLPSGSVCLTITRCPLWVTVIPVGSGSRVWLMEYISQAEYQTRMKINQTIRRIRLVLNMLIKLRTV